MVSSVPACAAGGTQMLWRAEGPPTRHEEKRPVTWRRTTRTSKSQAGATQLARLGNARYLSTRGRCVDRQEQVCRLRDRLQVRGSSPWPVMTIWRIDASLTRQRDPSTHEAGARRFTLQMAAAGACSDPTSGSTAMEHRLAVLPTFIFLRQLARRPVVAIDGVSPLRTPCRS